MDHEASRVVGFDGLEKLIDNLIDGVDDDVITTTRAMITQKLGVIGTRIQTKKLEAVMDKVFYFPDYTTRPYGYRLV